MTHAQLHAQAFHNLTMAQFQLYKAKRAVRMVPVGKSACRIEALPRHEKRALIFEAQSLIDFWADVAAYWKTQS